MVEFGIKYIRKDSFFHSIDPISKLAFLASILIITIFTFDRRLQFLIILIIFFTTFILARISFSEFVKPLLIIGPAMLGFVITTPLVIGSTPIFPGSSIPLYREGLDLGIFIVTRMVIYLTSTMTFVWSTHPRDLVQALSEAGLPYTTAHAFEIAIAFLPVIDYETRIISYSQKVRQVGKGKNVLFRNWERLVKLLITLLIRGIKHAQILAIAMNSRGFGAYKNRHYVEVLKRPRSGLIFRYMSLFFAAGWIIYSMFILK